VGSFENIVEIYGRVKSPKSGSLKYFCWVFEIDFENFRIKMETQIGIKIKLDNASS
jgi:hypothetical protein